MLHLKMNKFLKSTIPNDCKFKVIPTLFFCPVPGVVLVRTVEQDSKISNSWSLWARVLLNAIKSIDESVFSEKLSVKMSIEWHQFVIYGKLCLFSFSLLYSIKKSFIANRTPYAHTHKRRTLYARRERKFQTKMGRRRKKNQKQFVIHLRNGFSFIHVTFVNSNKFKFIMVKSFFERGKTCQQSSLQSKITVFWLLWRTCTYWATHSFA